MTIYEIIFFVPALLISIASTLLTQLYIRKSSEKYQEKTPFIIMQGKNKIK